MGKLTGIGIEAEEMGMVALIGALLIPGFIWISKARSGKSMAVRSVVVGLLVTSAAVLEGSMDKSANEVVE